MYTPDMIGSGQFTTCAHCGLEPTPEGHDGCLGTLPESVVMNACCGHGKLSSAYIQYWTGLIIRGECAVNEQSRLKREKLWSDLADAMSVVARSCKVSPAELREISRAVNSAFPDAKEAAEGLKFVMGLLNEESNNGEPSGDTSSTE